MNGADATPDAFVATTIVPVLLLNTPEAPDPGAVNVTFTPETGLFPASCTFTAKGFAKAVLIVADCGVVPAFAVIVDGLPAPPPAALNAASTAPQVSDAPSDALAEATPAVVWI